MTQFNFLDNALNVIILFAITVCFQKLHNYASTILICNRLRISKKNQSVVLDLPFPAGFIIHVVEGFFRNSSTNKL